MLADLPGVSARDKEHRLNKKLAQKSARAIVKQHLSKQRTGSARVRRRAKGMDEDRQRDRDREAESIIDV